MTSARRSLCATVLLCEAITLGLTTPVMITLGDVPRGTALAVGLGLALACLLTAGLLRAAWAYWIGHAIQVAAIGLGFVVGFMFVLGPVFALLWGVAFRVGGRIERERAEAYATQAEGEPERESDS
ncbi:DUF4233 domain-containing protein [Nocardioides silvaticus]|uniref:DUF4233 domain-containing protein n=1 Tax=Nocardioides silvaticus TaxID=2201891 RepID=UPI001FE7472E|nr:DUF4233 domain-containing protein [Nocardioides silvaticus]